MSVFQKDLFFQISSDPDHMIHHLCKYSGMAGPTYSITMRYNAYQIPQIRYVLAPDEGPRPCVPPAGTFPLVSPGTELARP